MKAKVFIIMGSDSDLSVMQEAQRILEQAQVACRINIVSAHRTPQFMQRFALNAARQGARVIIAGAGGAAHLPGMVASLTHLPVIGVPIQVGKLHGLDALLSIAQMPRGIPVATVAVDNGQNAGLLAIRILAISDARLAQWLKSFQKQLSSKVLKSNRRLSSRRK
jgi:5-(carboxyamino)imidazole ribonucleotide mutase